MIYFTSDQHFYHAKVISMCSRPFADLDDMHTTLIKNWNSVVGKLDEVYVLGDFVFRGKGTQANEILTQLKGRKYLIKGNHELYLKDNQFDQTAFEWIKDYHVLTYKDARFILFHFPILHWAYYHYKTVHLHGHIHSREFKHPNERAINIGVDVNDFRPVSINAIYDKALTDWEESNKGNDNNG